MSAHAHNSRATHERAARGEDPPISVRKSRMEMWRPGHVAETPRIADDDNLEASMLTKGRRAVRAPIMPAPKCEGDE
jgi:hypothetical protein